MLKKFLSLSGRESEVLREVARGKTNAQIADDLVISPATVKCHVSATIHKLGVKNRTGAAVVAQKYGMVD